MSFPFVFAAFDYQACRQSLVRQWPYSNTICEWIKVVFTLNSFDVITDDQRNFHRSRLKSGQATGPLLRNWKILVEPCAPNFIHHTPNLSKLLICECIRLGIIAPITGQGQIGNIRIG